MTVRNGIRRIEIRRNGIWQFGRTPIKCRLCKKIKSKNITAHCCKVAKFTPLIYCHIVLVKAFIKYFYCIVTVMNLHSCSLKVTASSSPPMMIPLLSSLISFIVYSLCRLNSMGDIIHPWRTPLRIQVVLDILSFVW